MNTIDKSTAWATITLYAFGLVMFGAWLVIRFGDVQVIEESRNATFHVRGNIQTATQADLAAVVNSPRGVITEECCGPSTRGRPHPPTIRGNPLFRP